MKEQQTHSFQDQSKHKISKILDPSYPLSRDEVVWMLGYLTKKVAVSDPVILGLSQPQLLKAFHAYSEASMSLLVRRSSNELEAERIRHWLKEAYYALFTD